MVFKVSAPDALFDTAWKGLVIWLCAARGALLTKGWGAGPAPWLVATLDASAWAAAGLVPLAAASAASPGGARMQLVAAPMSYE